MLYAQYCLNLLSLSNNVFCGCTCGADRSLLNSDCSNNTEIRRPRIEATPFNHTIDVGGSATFSCRASGDLLVGIEWEDSTGRQLQSRSGMLTISNARVSDDGVYRCVAYNSLSASSSQTVRLYVKPTIGVCESRNPCSDICTNDPRDLNKYICSCRPGRELNPDRRTCREMDVCKRLGNPCSHTCRADSTNPKGYICLCPDGMILDQNQRTCRVGACLRLKPCSHECVDDPRNPTSRYTCICPSGMLLNRDRRTCTVGACETLKPCSHNCTNDPVDPNVYRCSCPPGMRMSRDRRTCAADDVCSRSNKCAHICINNWRRPDGYECRCRSGSVLNPDGRTCRDNSICTRERPCSDICVLEPKTAAGYICQCHSGRYLNSDGRTCSDCRKDCAHRCATVGISVLCFCHERVECEPGPSIDVCAVFKPCDHTCTNVQTGYVCSCRPGFELESDRKTCSREKDPLEIRVDPLVTRIDAGGTGSITCTSSGGVGRHNRVWDPIVTNTRFDGSVFTVTNAAQSLHEREYTCTVTDEAGTTMRKTANVYIKDPISVTVSPKYTTVNAGESTSVTCTVHGGGNSRYLSWSRVDGKPLDFNIQPRAVSATSKRLVIGNARAEDSAEYICRYIDGSIQLQDTARVMVNKVIPTPDNVTVICESTVTLSCYTRGGAEMKSVTWKINDKNIVNPRISISSDGDQLVIPNVRAEDEGIYACDGTTAHTRTSTFLRLLVVCHPKVTVGVWIVGKENDKTNRRFLVGETAMLSCNVTGRPDVTEVYWRKRASNLRLATERNARPDGRGNEVASVTHVIRGLSVEDSGTYECRATNSVNQTLPSVESIQFEVIPDPPEIEVRGGGRVPQGNPHTLSCVVTSQPNYGPMRYQWTFVPRNQNNQNASMASSIIDALRPGSTLRIPRMDFRYEGQYTCQVTDRYQEQSPKRSAVLSIINATIPAPEVIDVLHCSVPLGADYIRWERASGKPLPSQAEQKGSHGQRLVISPVYPQDADEYICCATNSRKSKEGCSNTGQPRAPPRVQIAVRTPTSKPPRYLEGEPLHLECLVVLPGWPVARSVTWEKDGRPYYRAQGNSIRIQSMTNSDQGIYKCKATSGPGLFGEDDVEVKVGCIKPSHVTISVGDTHDEGYLIGSTALWSCEADGSPEIEYMWYKDNNRRDVASTQSSLSVPVSRSSAGRYTCRASNRCGNSEASEVLRIRNKKPGIPTIYPKDEKYQPGSYVSITCESTGGFPKPTLTWYKGNDVVVFSQEDRVVLHFDSFDQVHAGRYECRATNTEGSSSGFIDITPRCTLNKPRITTTPSIISIGDNVTLTCSAGNSDPHPDFLWRRNGQAQSSMESLRINMVDSYLDGMQYSCEVSNTLCGQSETESITLRVSGKLPTVKILPGSINPIAGSDASYTCQATGGDPAPVLEWLYNGQIVTTVSGRGNSLVLLLDDISRQDNGQYTCRGRNRHGSDDSIIVIAVTERSPDDVQIIGNLTYDEGGMINLECRLVGPMPQPPGTLEWMVNGRMEERSTGQRSILFRRRMADNMQGSYTCRAYNGNYDMSKTVQVAMNEKKPQTPVIVGPSGEQVYEGEASRNSWECQAEAGARITWKRRKPNEFVQPEFFPYPHKVFRVTKAAMSDEDLYYCTATNDEGESPPSRNVNITVIRRRGDVSIVPSPAPNTSGGRYIEGTDISLRCTIQGLPSSTGRMIEWSKQGSSATIMTGEYLQIRASQRNAGTYQCTARYLNRDVIDQDSLRIEVAVTRCPDQVSITGVDDPENYVRERSRVELRCLASAFPNPTYQWYKGASPLAVGQSLSIGSVSSRDMGEYSCRVSVDNCEDGMTSLVLRLVEPPRIIEHIPQPRDVAPKRDSSLTLTCRATGSPTPTISWTWNGGSPPAAAAQVINGGNSLYMARMSSQYNGLYACIASHRFSPPTAQWTWNITTNNLQPPTNAVVEPRYPPTLYYRQGFNLICTAEGDELKFSWKYRQSSSSSWRDASRMQGAKVIRIGDTSSKLNFTSLDDSEHNGFYQCQVDNDANSTESNIVNIAVSVKPKVAFVCNTFDHVICLQALTAGDDLKLQCSALGKPTMRYRWTDSKNNMLTNRQLYMKELVEVDDSDDYMCTVQGNDGVSMDQGLYRVFVTTHPVQYNIVRAHSVCQVETSGALVNITISLKPSSGQGLVYSYSGTEGLEVRLELRGLQPVLILRQDSNVLEVPSRQILSMDEYTPIKVTVDSQSAQIQSEWSSLSGRGFSIPANGELSLMGESKDERSGLTGIVAVLEVNGAIERIAKCDSKDKIKTNYNPCVIDICGKGNCVPAPTLKGYYCFCNSDGRPAMRCNADGTADVQSITNDKFIMQHFRAIFGRDDYFVNFPQITSNGGVHSVGSTTYYGLTSGSSVSTTSIRGYNISGYNTGGYNSGGYNTGGYNIGGYNTGGYNSGGYNTGGGGGGGSGGGGSGGGGSGGGGSSGGGSGGYNSGGYNSGGGGGVGGSGGYSTGGYNSGGYNSGVGGSGGYSTGGYNSGGYNSGGSGVGGSGGGGSGGYNSGGGGGVGGSGGYSTGGYNSGGYNSGGYNSGGGGSGGGGSSGGGSSGGAGYMITGGGGGSVSVNVGGSGYSDVSDASSPSGHNSQPSQYSGAAYPADLTGTVLTSELRRTSYVSGQSQSNSQSGDNYPSNSQSDAIARPLITYGSQPNSQSGGSYPSNSQSGGRYPSNSQSSAIARPLSIYGSYSQPSSQSGGGSGQSNSQPGGGSGQSNSQPGGGSGQSSNQQDGYGTIYNVVNRYSSVQSGQVGAQSSSGSHSAQGTQYQDGDVTDVQPMDESDKATGLSAGFNGRGYLQLPRALASWLRLGGASLELTTTADDGLFFYYGGKEGSTMKDSEYIALAVQDGYVEMSYRLSRSLEPTRIRHSVKVNDGNRHGVSFTRNRGKANLIVDGISVKGSHRSSYLGATGDIYIGGVPDIAMVSELYAEMFTGCISNLRTTTYENSSKDIDLFGDLVKSSHVSKTC